MWKGIKGVKAVPVGDMPNVPIMKSADGFEICESLKKLGFIVFKQNRVLENEVLRIHTISISQAEDVGKTNWGKLYISFDLLDKTFRISRFGSSGYLTDLDMPLTLAILDQARAFGWAI